MTDEPAGEVLGEILARDLDEGFALLVDQHQHVLLNTALRLCGHRQDAEDLAADCLLRAFRDLAGRTPEALRELRVRSWLLTILVNGWRNELRTRSRRPVQSELTELHDRVHPGPTLEDVVENQDRRADLAARLHLLPVRQREAVVLRHVLDLPLAEVAQILQCPEGTAKSHVSRGLQGLRGSYADPTPAGRS